MTMASDYQQLQEDAQKKIAAGNIEAAIEQLEQAYTLEQTFEVNQQLVQYYYEHEQLQTATDLIKEFVADYVQGTESQQSLYVDVCVRANYFIDARQFVAQLPVNNQLPYVETIIEAENRYRDDQHTALVTNQKAFFHLSEVPMGQQSRAISKAKQLPLQEFVFSARGILVDPFAYQLTRVSVLDELMKLAVVEPVDMLTLIETKINIKPSDIKALEQQPIVIEVMGRLAESPLANDPSQYLVLEQQFRLCLMLLMPNFDEAIGDVQTWMEQTLLMFGFEFQTDKTETETQKIWREGLSNALLKL